MGPTFAAVQGSYRLTTIPKGGAPCSASTSRLSLATVAVAAGLLTPAASALGAGVTDGTSNTVLLGAHAGRGPGDAPRIDLAGPFTPNNF